MDEETTMSVYALYGIRGERRNLTAIEQHPLLKIPLMLLGFLMIGLTICGLFMLLMFSFYEFLMQNAARIEALARRHEAAYQIYLRMATVFNWTIDDPDRAIPAHIQDLPDDDEMPEQEIVHEIRYSEILTQANNDGGYFLG